MKKFKKTMSWKEQLDIIDNILSTFFEADEDDWEELNILSLEYKKLTDELKSLKLGSKEYRAINSKRIHYAECIMNIIKEGITNKY